MSNYTPLVNYASKDALITGDPAKRILGTEISAELNAIGTMSATKEDTANKNVNSGYAGLDGTARIAKAQAPSATAYEDETNTFTLNQTFNGAIVHAATTVQYRLDETDAAANERLWDILVGSGQLIIRTRTDADGVGVNALVIDRGGTAVNSIDWLGTAFTFNGVSINNASILTAGTLTDARVAQSNVTQHQAALTIAETQITDGAVYARLAGNETISGNWIFTGSHELQAAAPRILLDETDAPADERHWSIRSVGGSLAVSVGTDASPSSDTNSPILIDRTGTTIDAINLAATAVNVNGTSVRDGAILTAGTVNTARLGSGTANSSTFLRGDQTWQQPAFSSLSGSIADGQVPASAVTQHQASLSIARTQLTDTIVSDTLAATHNDYSPTGYGANTTVLRLNSAAGTPCTITGLQGGTAGRRILIIRQAVSGTILLANENAGSAAANRFTHQGGGYTLNTQVQSVELFYDGITSRWHVLS